MGLRIRLTGRLGVEGDKGTFDSSDLPGRQGRLVLAYLALNHHPVPRDELAELVWGEELPRSWERDLSAIVSKLKALLGRAGAEGALSGAFGCYELRPPPGTTIDVESARLYLEEAEEARRAGSLAAALGAASTAAQLGRRPFLPGDEGEWLAARREELRLLAMQAYDVQIACHRARGEAAAAIRAAAAVIELDPFHESGHATLMRLHLEAGNRAEALRAYERCRVLLVEQLGVPPGPELEAVHREALRLDLDEHEPARSLPPPVGVALSAGLLVGRGEQLARLRAAWERIVQGQSQFVLLAGEPGIGKTRLAGELAAEAHAAGAHVLFGRCDQEPLASYQPFTEALRQWVAIVPVSEARAVGAGTAPALAGLLPELAARVGVPPGAEAQDRLALYDAVGGLLAAIAMTAPAVLLIDDLHAADLPTLALLRRLARDTRPSGLLCIGTYRHASPDSRAQVADVVAELRLDGLAEEILLPGLDAEATAALVEARSGRRPTASEARTLHERTGGNPLFVVAVTDSPAAAGESVPPGVRDAIGRHLSRLPETDPCRADDRRGPRPRARSRPPRGGRRMRSGRGRRSAAAGAFGRAAHRGSVRRPGVRAPTRA
jgi:DNA-binding SARP family transcriptional activator